MRESKKGMYFHLGNIAHSHHQTHVSHLLYTSVRLHFQKQMTQAIEEPLSGTHAFYIYIFWVAFEPLLAFRGD